MGIKPAEELAWTTVAQEESEFEELRAHGPTGGTPLLPTCLFPLLPNRNILIYIYIYYDFDEEYN